MKHRISCAIVTLSILLFMGCANRHLVRPVINLPDYELVFHDEFDGNSLDTAVWGFHNLGKRRSAVNLKEACIVNKDKELEIRNWTEIDGVDTVHHAGMVQTKENFTYGYYEARIKFDIESGSWGAFWIMYNNFQREFAEADRPGETGVEMDIIEFLSTKSGYGVHNLHWNGYGKFHKTMGSGERKHGQLNGYHTYGLLWTPDGYTFYIDGEESWHTEKAASHVPEYVILSTEIEDKGWAGDVPAGGYGSFETTKNKMLVDYIRVYQKKE